MTRVCLVLEGCYPYVTGGVGKWAHDLIASLPELEFTILALWPTRESLPPPRYPRLPNVRDLRTIFMLTAPGPARGSAPPEAWRWVEDLHRGLKTGDVSALGKICPHAGAMDFLKDPAAWDLLCRLYQDFAPPDTSFPDYFWTWRATHLPLFSLFREPLEKADVVHVISTGYAGCLGALHKLRGRIPLITTEHGLYTRERAQEIWEAEWIPGQPQADARRAGNFFKSWWNRMFQALERITYAASDRIVALFEENRRYQVAHGAPEERTLVIPNGVDLAYFDAVKRKAGGPPGPFHVGLVGRIVPIKDIKTFISACKSLVDRLGPGAVKVSLIGPADEDETYAAQCVEMTRLLGLQDVVTFVGKADVRRYYETLDAVVLTSLSEGQPLVLLEALACGIPAVATDVGSCREILEGRSDEDRALGPAGFVTPLADPEATAEALHRLATRPELAREMGAAGRRRVERYYRLDQVRTAYLELYESLARGEAAAVPAGGSHGRR
jgi:glycosyltransferase involved in cell wall biosynthesis